MKNILIHLLCTALSDTFYPACQKDVLSAPAVCAEDCTVKIPAVISEQISDNGNQIMIYNDLTGHDVCRSLLRSMNSCSFSRTVRSELIGNNMPGVIPEGESCHSFPRSSRYWRSGAVWQQIPYRTGIL